LATTVTIRDVAKHAGVGVGTVSRVLNESEAVRETTRSKVLSAIADLNYSPSPVARRLSGGKTMAVGIIVPFFTNASVVKRLQGVVSVLGGSEYDLVLFDVESSENRDVLLTNIVQRKMVDALLILSLRPHDGDMANFLEAKIPAVVVDAFHPALTSVMVDNVTGAMQAVRHLIDLGHRKIAFLSDFPDYAFNRSPVVDRLAGYRQALQEADIPFRSDYYTVSALTKEDARHQALQLLSLDDRPTAVFAYSDTQAIGVLEAARDLGLRVPEDLSVVGYDDIEAAEYAQLTTIRQSLFESGVLGVELLLQVIDDRDREPQEILLTTELVIRGSTAAVSAA
jgi:DNA-binding LacI/PurR family transcriptional regulator